jgi:hypothetical protein
MTVYSMLGRLTAMLTLVVLISPSAARERASEVGQSPPNRRGATAGTSATTQSTSGLSWYGSSLAVGKRP